MVGHRQFLSCPRENRYRHGIATYEQHSLSAVGSELAPASVLMISCVLRFWEVLKFLGYLIMIDANVLRCLSVGIVVDGASAIIAKVIHRRWNIHHIAEARENELGIVRVDGCLNLDASIGKDGVDHVLQELEVVGTEGLVGLLGQPFPVAVAALETCATWCLALNVVSHRYASIAVLHHLVIACLVLQVVQAIGIPVLIDPVVVVHPCAKGIEMRAVAILEHFLASIAEAVDGAVCGVELHVEATTA